MVREKKEEEEINKEVTYEQAAGYKNMVWKRCKKEKMEKTQNFQLDLFQLRVTLVILKLK